MPDTDPPAAELAMAAVDVDSLPPTEYLIMDALAARARLGETHWTFPSRLRAAMVSLADRDLLWWQRGPTPRTIQAFLTGEGRAAVLYENYKDPCTAEIERLHARVAELAPFEPRTAGFHVGEDGAPVIDVHFPESFAQLMLASFRWYLDEHQAPNYVHIPMTDMVTGDTYVCTIGRPGGNSPHELRREAEAALAGAAKVFRNLAEQWKREAARADDLAEQRAAQAAVMLSARAKAHQDCATGLLKAAAVVFGKDASNG